jgi:hypothetical protein
MDLEGVDLKHLFRQYHQYREIDDPIAFQGLKVPEL